MEIFNIAKDQRETEDFLTAAINIVFSILVGMDILSYYAVARHDETELPA